MRRLLALFAAATLLSASPWALSHEYQAGALHIDHPWARPLPPVAPNGGAYLTIMNHSGEADRLLGARTERAAVTEIHTHVHENGLMQMRQVDAVDIPAHGTATLKPGADHLMLMGLTAPLAEGDSFALTLIFEKAGEVQVEIKVEQPASAAQPAAAHDAHQGH